MKKKFSFESAIELTMTALFVSVIFLCTMAINIKLPVASNGGLIHLGNVPLFIGAGIFGKKLGAYSGAIGMGLFDLVSGWTIWSPFTIVISALIGYTFGSILSKKFSVKRYLFAVAVAMVIKSAGYYIAEAIIIRNLLIPLGSIYGNVIQIIVAGIMAFPVILPLRKYFLEE